MANAPISMINITVSARTANVKLNKLSLNDICLIIIRVLSGFHIGKVLTPLYYNIEKRQYFVYK